MSISQRRRSEPLIPPVGPLFLPLISSLQLGDPPQCISQSCTETNNLVSLCQGLPLEVRYSTKERSSLAFQHLICGTKKPKVLVFTVENSPETCDMLLPWPRTGKNRSAGKTKRFYRRPVKQTVDRLQPVFARCRNKNVLTIFERENVFLEGSRVPRWYRAP